MNKIDNFAEGYAYLSNFFEVPVWYKGIMFKNSEAAYQAQKMLNPDDKFNFKYLSAKEAKKLGRKVELRPDWEDVKLKVMEEICLAKFTQNATLRNALILTGDAELIEGNTWGDKFWGCVNGKGENNLGKILMKTREILKNNYHFDMCSPLVCHNAYNTVKKGDECVIATLDINCIRLTLQIENIYDEKRVVLFVYEKYANSHSSTGDYSLYSMDYESDTNYIELLASATSEVEIIRFMTCKLFKWCDENNVDITLPVMPDAEIYFEEAPVEEASKLGVMFFDKIPADDAKKINSRAEHLFNEAQHILDEYIKLMDYKWDMGVIKRPEKK